MEMKKSPAVQGSLAETAVLSSPSTTTTTAPSSPADHLRIKWIKLESDTEKVVLVTQNGIVIETGSEYQGRVSVPANSKETEDASLTIQQLRYSDKGMYHCEVMNGMEETHTTVSLDVSGEVIYPLNKYMTLEEATTRCESLGAVLASPGQLWAAWREGLRTLWLIYGWLSDGSTRYVISLSKSLSTGRPSGVHTFSGEHAFPSPNQRAGVYCYKVTPVFDPCKKHTVLDDLSRATNNTEVLNWCDRYVRWYGWYRLMYNGKSIRMPESCSVITCHNSSAWISLSRCLLSEAGFSAEVFHLNNPDCKGTVRDGRVEFHFNNDDRKCGTQLKVNGTHAIYENSIQGKVDSADGLIISRERTLNLQFACVYPLTQNTSMDVAVDVLKSITQLTLPPGKGTYQIRMIPYKDADFTELFDGAVAQTSDEEIYISVDVEGVDSRQFSSVLDLCWATPTNNSTSSITWSLITKQCANPEDGTVEVLRNGESTSSRFSFRMFTFNGHPPQLYLHCSLHLCLLEGNSCAPTCKSSHLKRLRRSSDLNDTSATMVSFGPLIFPSGKTDLLDVLAPQPKRYRPKV
ncbi:pancreatic secretory granule membrane major glycoprotein GP2-like [Engraulis encrasicolus]|uniref:pancreatic secretory granule membrane major glycoprotein GP2-like n=1 Tax=Engraulis encrasicolus TaxID=184585 RepID=UPI002FCEF1ED